MKMADYELEQGKTRTQPLLLKTITKKSGTLKIQIKPKEDIQTSRRRREYLRNSNRKT